MVWNARFADILSKLPNGRRRVDYGRFHDVVPVSFDKAKRRAAQGEKA